MQSSNSVNPEKGSYDHTLPSSASPGYEPQGQAHLRLPHSASPREQLELWHANRGDKSFAASIIPSWKVEQPDERVTRNPFKLAAMVGPFGWIMFIR